MWQTRDGDILPLSAVRLARVAAKNSARVVKTLSRAHRSIIATLVIRSPHRGDAFNESLLPVRRACVHSISRAGFTGRDQNKGSALRSSQMRAAGVCLNAAGSARLAMRHRSACETSVARGMRPIAERARGELESGFQARGEHEGVGMTQSRRGSWITDARGQAPQNSDAPLVAALSCLLSSDLGARGLNSPPAG